MLILLALAFNGRTHRDELIEVLWPDPDEMPDWSHEAIGVKIFRLRQKLAAFGYGINVCYGWGWALEKTDE